MSLIMFDPWSFLVGKTTSPAQDALALFTEAASLDALCQGFGRLNRLGRLEGASALILTSRRRRQDRGEGFLLLSRVRPCCGRS